MDIFYEQIKQGMDCFLPFEETDPLAKFRKQYKDCQGCNLSKNRKGMVFGFGVIKSKIMFIGICPSPYDVDVGVPFSDQPGRKLQGLVEYLSRSLQLDNNIYYTNLTLCPGNPTIEEIDFCRERLIKEIEHVQPQNIILLGEEINQGFCAGEAARLTKKVIKLDRYYSVFMTRNLREILFKRDEVKLEVKEDLDFIVECVGNGKQNDTNSSQVIPRQPVEKS